MYHKIVKYTYNYPTYCRTFPQLHNENRYVGRLYTELSYATIPASFTSTVPFAALQSLYLLMLSITYFCHIIALFDGFVLS